jgi:hypothetical protein
LPSSSHATYLAFYFSFQSRFDYWLATNYLIYTDPLAASMDEFLRRKLCDIAGFDIFSPQPGVQVPDFTERRVSLKVKNGGLGFRPLSNRFLALNSLNNTMTLAIDHKDEKNVVTKGLWNSLSCVLGVGSFDFANRDHRWTAFFTSGASFGNDSATLIARVQDHYTTAATALEKTPEQQACFLTVPAAAFGFGVTKMHKKAQDELRKMDYELLLKDTKLLAKDDQRSIAFQAITRAPSRTLFRSPRTQTLTSTTVNSEPHWPVRWDFPL